MSRYRCPECDYEYDEAQGDPHQGLAAQTLWHDLPDSFACPDCAVRYKEDFVVVAEMPPDGQRGA